MIKGLYVWACFQNLVLAISIYLVFKNRSNFYLALFFFLNSALLASQLLLRFEGYMELYPQLFLVTELVHLCLGPILMLYYINIFGLKKNPNIYLHFIPAILYIFYFIVYQVWHLYPLSASNYLKVSNHAILVILTSTSLFFYSWIIWKEIDLYKHKFKNLKLNIDLWLYLLVTFLLTKALEGLIILIKKLFFNDLTVIFNSFYQPFFIITETLVLLVVGYFGLKEANAFRLEKLSYENETKSKKLLITQEDAQIFLERLSKAMEVDKIYIDTDLDEKKVAKSISIQSYQLSILLNKYLGKSFAEFVNSYRIEEAKRMLSDDKSSQNKMFSIAIDCGFHSESVFYTNFKKFTGTTPRQFQKSIKSLKTK